MDNVEMQVQGNILTITVDLTQRLGPSASGKTIGIASTRGNKPLDGYPGVSVGLNIYTKS